MFGTFRFLLAQMVLVEHVLEPLHVKIGCAAVVNFFMLSGYVMTYLVRTQYGRLGKPTLFFFADRALRIFPQYLFFIFITQIYLIFSDFQFFHGYFAGEPSLYYFFVNALIVPDNYAFFFPDFQSHLLIPPAWSLGLEEQFYWVFPFLTFKKWLGRIVTSASAIIFCLAMAEQINGELFAFRLLPGTLMIFMLGKSLADFNMTKNREALWTMLVLYSVCLGVLGLLLFQPELQTNLKLNVILGIVVGFPILCGLSRLPRRKWDDFIGNSSYGIFLSHVLVINLIINSGLLKEEFFPVTLAAIFFSTLSGFGGYYLVEQFVVPIRMRLRLRNRLAA